MGDANALEKGIEFLILTPQSVCIAILFCQRDAQQDAESHETSEKHQIYFSTYRSV
jgi:hypothetical protein